MALDATTEWEIRASGNALNGGGFADLDPGTSVDYCQQDAAELSLTDFATAGIGVTTLTSATGGFTAAMVGNIIYLASGTNVTAGYYQITVYTNTNTVALDSAPDDGVGGIASGVGKLGGAAVFESKPLAAAIAGNTYWVEAETHTLTDNLSVAGPAASTPVFVEGYSSIRGDGPLGDARPLIAGGAYDLRWTTQYVNWVFRYLRWTTANSNGFYPSCYVRPYNCKFTQTSSTAGYIAMRGHYSAVAIQCEFTTPNGAGVGLRNISGGTTLVACYFHDCGYGFSTNQSSGDVSGCIFDTCSVGGVYCPSILRIAGSTFYNCGKGIDLSGLSFLVRNNILDSCTVGIDADAGNLLAVGADYNNFSNNGTDRTGGIGAGPNDTTLDPEFTDAANGDFSIGGNLGIGFPGEFPGELSTSYPDLGAVQRSAGGGAAGFALTPNAGVQ